MLGCTRHDPQAAKKYKPSQERQLRKMPRRQVNSRFLRWESQKSQSEKRRVSVTLDASECLDWNRNLSHLYSCVQHYIHDAKNRAQPERNSLCMCTTCFRLFCFNVRLLNRNQRPSTDWYSPHLAPLYPLGCRPSTDPQPGFPK